MLLRDHPLMSYKGLRNWPPDWMWIDGKVTKNPKGEVGTLVEVQASQRQGRIDAFWSLNTKIPGT